MINERFLKFEMLALGFFFNSFEKPGDIVGHYDVGTFDNAKEI